MSVESIALRTRSPSLFLQDRFRRLFFQFLGSLQDGELTVEERGQSWQFGNPSKDGLRCHLQILNPAVYQALVLGGSNGAAEAYMDGHWQTDNLTGLIQLMARNQSQLDVMEGGLALIGGWVSRLWHAARRNSRDGSKKNIAAHYDLGNDFFELFLDSRMMYSSALYHQATDSLEAASEAKLKRICEKLQLNPEDHLLEIGTGWGGMAIYAATHYGCRVTTTTISDAQYEASRRKVESLGLQQQISVIKKDYRDLTGQFDKVVSIEMVEAVGHQYLSEYCHCLKSLLNPQGQALIQAITIDDLRYQTALRSVDFIKKYIFPGSFIPCVSLLTNEMAKAGLRLFNLEDMGESYAYTLRDWRKGFAAHRQTVSEQGFDERFQRMWNFYLCYCEGGFLEKSISVVQMHLTAPDCRRAQWLPQVECQADDVATIA